MRVLFLDDQAEILDVYRQILNPLLVDPPISDEKEDIFAPPDPVKEEDGFHRVRNIEFKGSFFQQAGEAVENFRRFANAITRHQVAVLDMQLPESSGLEVALQMLEIDLRTNFVFVTAHSDYSIHDIARKLGTDETRFMFLKKPFELQEILQNLIFVREKLHRERWQVEALKNLINFTKGFKVDSLAMFDLIFQLDTMELARNMAQNRVKELLQKNEKVLELTEMILANDATKTSHPFSINDLLDQFGIQDKVQLEYDPEAFKGRILLGDRNQLASAMRALVTNAQEHSTNSVTVSARLLENRRVEFMVRDDGAGIDQQYVNEIFEPGFKLKSKSPKAGFGLALVKKIVGSIHKTDLFIKSEPGKGTAIKFSLPCAS